MTGVWPLLWLGCAGPRASAPQEAPTADVPAIELRADGLTDAYRAAFADETPALARALADAGCAEGPVGVDVTYADRIGRIVGRGPWAAACRARVAGGAVDLSAVTPIGRAFAGYRNRLATTRDLRLTAFRVGVDVGGGGGPACVVWLAGQIPPDGSAFAATDAPGAAGAVAWVDPDLAACVGGR